MKIIKLTVILSIFSLWEMKGAIVLSSPDGRYRFTFEQKPNAGGNLQMYYALAYRGKAVVEASELGVFIDNHLVEDAMGIPRDSGASFCENMQLVDTAQSAFDRTWKPVYGERSEYRDRYNEMVLKFRKGKGGAAVATAGYLKEKAYMLNLVVRAYNEGVAFRYAFPEAPNGLFLHITGEQTQFTLPEGALAYYEKWAQGPYSLVPLRGWTDECERPLTLKLKNGLTLALTEAGLTDFARMKFRLCSEKPSTLQASIYDSVDIIPPYEMPWRVIMAAETPAALIENNSIILNLNPPCEMANTRWICPGKAIRVTQLHQAAAMQCVDFAAERGLQYVHLDAGWYGKEFLAEADATQADAAKDLNIPDLVRYAGQRGIGVWLYVNQRALSRQLDDLLPLYQKWGVRGVKFGFVQVGSHHWTGWLHEAVKKCAQYHLMVDIHDEYRPTGFSRTYPNLLTQEGIRGNEEFPDATHNATLPFTRFLAGAGDYTICYFDPRIKATHAHQLALAVVYYSPLQFLYWYDTPDRYSGEPELEFFDKVKTVWDETKIIDGAVGEYVIAARRSGSEWFVGAITNTESRSIAVPLDFLEPGQKYAAKVFTDSHAAPTRTKVAVEDISVDKDDVLKFELKASGGCAIHLTIDKIAQHAE